MSEASEKRSPAETSTASAGAEYEAPRVERVLTQEDLEQELLYAGTAAAPSFPP